MSAEEGEAETEPEIQIDRDETLLKVSAYCSSDKNAYTSILSISLYSIYWKIYLQ